MIPAIAMHRPGVVCLVALVFASLCGVPARSQADPSVSVSVNTAAITHPHARLLLGTSFDSRTGVQGSGPGGTLLPTGYYDVNNQLLTGLAPLWSQVQLTTVRYPGNGVDQIDWRETVGPVAQRSPQPYAGNSLQTQVIRFGFDDFMAMVSAHNSSGTQPVEVQIMVSTDTSLTVPTQAELIQMAADWVEYANAPADSSNVGGGIDWAAQRAANGHPTPYDIRIWNVGNEPWGPTQAFNFNVAGSAAAFAALAQQFITAMKAIDPTILITIPSAAHPLGTTVDNSKQAAWDNTMLTQLGGQIYGLSEHIYYDATSPRGITTAAGSIDAVLARIAASPYPSVRLLIGDHAHQIPSNQTPAQADYAMQWHAALTTADFLLMLASKPVERANFWIYGSTQATWHPIRKNANGTFTLMPVAGLFTELAALLHDQALATTTVSPPSLDGTASYSVRSMAFRAVDGSSLSWLAVNRDTIASHTVAVTGLDGWTAVRARIFTGAASADSFARTAVALPVVGGVFALPPGGMLCVEFVPALAAVGPGGRAAGVSLGAPLPNPATRRVAIQFDAGPDASREGWVRVEVLDVGGRLVRHLDMPSTSATIEWDLRDASGLAVQPGLYFVSARLARERVLRRLIVTR